MKILGQAGRVLALVLALAPAAPVSAQQLEEYNSTQMNQGGQQQAPRDPQKTARIRTELGALYFQAGNMAVALDELALAIKADSAYFPAYNVRGLVYTALREFDKAEADFQLALKRAPDDPEVNNNYGWFLCEIGKERQSIVFFLNALKSPLYETPERAYANAGTCALKAGDLVGAQRYLLQAVQLSKDGAAQPRLQLAKLFYQQGNIAEARIYLTEALRMLAVPTAEALWLGIRLERRLGDRVSEGSYASQLRSRYPSSAEYQAFLRGDFE